MHPLVVKVRRNETAVLPPELVLVKRAEGKGTLKMVYTMPGVVLQVTCHWPYKVVNDSSKEISIFKHHISKTKNRFRSNQTLLKHIMYVQMRGPTKPRCDDLHSVPLSLVIRHLGFIYYFQSHVLKNDQFSQSHQTHGDVNITPKPKLSSNKSRGGLKTNKTVPPPQKKEYRFSSDGQSEVLIQNLAFLLKYEPCNIQVTKEQQYLQHLSHDLRIYEVKHFFQQMNIQNESLFVVKYFMKTHNLIPISVDVESD